MKKKEIIKRLRALIRDLEAPEVQPTPEPTPPVYEDRNLLKGVQMQGSSLEQYHQGKSFEEVVQRVLQSVLDSGATTIRIPGGKNARGAWYNGPGSGVQAFESEPGADAPKGRPSEHNHFRVYVEVAKRAGIGVWVTLHMYMTKADVLELFDWLLSTGVQIDGVSVSNEPYAPQYKTFNLYDDEFRSYREIIDALRNDVGYTGWIAIPTLLGLGMKEREERAKRWNSRLKSSGLLAEKGVILDIHPYCPPEAKERGFTATQYLKKFFTDLEAEFGTDVFYVLTEWAHKKQAVEDISEVTGVIADYLSEFPNYPIIAAYYNTMPGDVDDNMREKARREGKEVKSPRGLFSFENMELTPQGEYFAAF